VLPNVTINNSGVYTVVVTNNYGSVTSEVSTLTVSWPPTVAEQPVNQTNTAGTTANFSVSAGNTGPFTYQWYLNGTNLPDGVITVASWAPPSWPFGITFDTVGNLYISDIGNYKVRKIDSNEIITTVAGNGSTDYAGNGVAATNSGLAGPFAIAFDSFGNLYITDTGYNQIVRVNTNGTIATVTGNGSTGYSGDGGVATNAELTTPEGITFDSFGNLYIADSGSNRIRMVNTNGIISTVAGNGSTNYNGDVATNAGLSFPTGITCDGAGNVYIADTGNNRIRMVSTNGIITTVAGNGGKNYTADGGAATNVSLNAPMGVAFDAFGNLYIADTGNNRICMVNTSGTITTTPTDGNEIYDSNLSGPVGIALDKAGNLYVTDTGYRRIREVLLYSGYPTLVLKNIGAENAGNYSVVITSPYGGITSAVASLTVTIPTTAPQISTSGLTFGLQNNQFGFNVGAMAGQTIIVEGSTNLVNWTPLFTNTPNGTPFYFYDPQWTNLPSRFYRARQE
jgi:sugar lactone lactonase YvrE